jgi:hypothetical protein
MQVTTDRSRYRRGGDKAKGFARLSVEEGRAMASRGGKLAHALGRAHTWTSEEAKAAGRKGGSISRRRAKSV